MWKLFFFLSVSLNDRQKWFFRLYKIVSLLWCHVFVSFEFRATGDQRVSCLIYGGGWTEGSETKALHSNIHESISHTEHCCKRDTLAQRGFRNVGSMIQTTSGQMFLLVIQIFLDRACFPASHGWRRVMDAVCPASHWDMRTVFFSLSYSSFIQSPCSCVCVFVWVCECAYMRNGLVTNSVNCYA